MTLNLLVLCREYRNMIRMYMSLNPINWPIRGIPLCPTKNQEVNLVKCIHGPAPNLPTYELSQRAQVPIDQVLGFGVVKILVQALAR